MIQLAKWDTAYRARVSNIAQMLHSDGCTGVPDFYLDACYEHDIHYRTHHTVDARPITFGEANHWLGERIKESSWFGRWSPMAWWRERAVALLGYVMWAHPDKGSNFCEVYKKSLLRRRRIRNLVAPLWS